METQSTIQEISSLYDFFNDVGAPENSDLVPGTKIQLSRIQTPHCELPCCGTTTKYKIKDPDLKGKEVVYEMDRLE